MEVFPRLLVEHLGGDEAVDMLCDHHGPDAMTYDELVERYDMSRAAIHRRIVKARRRLRVLGLMPEAWEAREVQGVANER